MSWLTTMEAAQLAGITPTYVRFLALTGRLRYSRFGRSYMINPDDLETWSHKRAARRERRLINRIGGSDQ